MEKGESQSKFWQPEGKDGKAWTESSNCSICLPCSDGKCAKQPTDTAYTCRDRMWGFEEVGTQVPARVVFTAVNC